MAAGAQALAAGMAVVAAADWRAVAGIALSSAATAYAALAAAISCRTAHRGTGGHGANRVRYDTGMHAGADAANAAAVQAVEPQAVSVLKPLCGDEPGLYGNLATFCHQAHPRYQIVFGVRDAADPAVQVVRRLQAEYPGCDIALAINPARHGSNPKVSNLINMLALARHDLLVLADADIAVAPDYLQRVTAPLVDTRTGVVTSLYRGRAVGGWWSRLGAQFIDDWFAPSVRVAHAGGSSSFAFGATIALRRDALHTVAGFRALADRLADDYWLGELTRRHGLATVLSDVVVRTDVTEDSLPALWRHELRWMRTIRSLNPAGFAFTFITFTWPMLLIGLVLAPGPLSAALLIVGGLARSMLAAAAAAADSHARGAPTGPAAQAPGTASGVAVAPLAAVLRAPVRDLLLLAEWAAALVGSRVHWREDIFTVRDRIPVAPLSSPSTPSRETTLPERTP